MTHVGGMEIVMTRWVVQRSHALAESWEVEILLTGSC
jgi:hypothetical protein